MNNFLIESSICIAVFYLVYLMLFRNDHQFIRNRFYLLAGILLSLAIPLTTFSVQEVPWEIPQAIMLEEASTFDADFKPTGPVESKSSLDFISTIYWIGLATAAFYFCLRALLLFAWLNKCKRGIVQNKNVYFTEGRLPTASIFNKVFWNNQAGYEQEEAKAIMAHEQQHINQLHTLDLLLVELAQIIWWFNPLLILYKKSIKQQHEYLADDAAAKLISNNAYQQLMINEVAKKLELSLTHYFGTSSIKKRIIMLNHKTENMFSRVKSIVIIPVIALLLVVYSCEQEESLNNSVITENIKGLDVTREVVEKEGKFFVEGIVTNAQGNPVEKVGLLFPGEKKPIFASSKEDGSYSVVWEENKSIKEIKIRVFVPLTKEEKEEQKRIAETTGAEMDINYEKVQEDGKTFLVGKITTVEDGKSMPGVNVIINGTVKGTITDIKGSFKLEIPENGTLNLSFIGFKTKKIDF